MIKIFADLKGETEKSTITAHLLNSHKPEYKQDVSSFFCSRDYSFFRPNMYPPLQGILFQGWDKEQNSRIVKHTGSVPKLPGFKSQPYI